VGKYNRAGEAAENKAYALSHWIHKATVRQTLSDYVILVALRRQQRLHERASVVRYSTLLDLSFFPLIP
jgi:hypothetical protein